jgi:DNA-binding response OmpR family regulator
MNIPQPRILVIDDEPLNLRLMVEALQERGYRLAIAQSGAQGLQSAKHSAPDLILLDIRMPEMNGFEVCRRLRQDPATRDIPLLFLSALDDVAYKEEGFQLGADDYVTKPVHRRELVARVGAHLARYRRLHAKPPKESADPTKPTITPKELFDRIAADLLSHIDQTPNIDDLARQAFLSRSVFNRRFRQIHGASPLEWLLEKRMQHAALQLQTSDDPIREVAAALGYASPAAFTTAFRRRFGTTPTAYREAHSPPAYGTKRNTKE